MCFQPRRQLENLLPNVANGDVDPFRGQRFRVGRTDAHGGTGDDGILATQ